MAPENNESAFEDFDADTNVPVQTPASESTVQVETDTAGAPPVSFLGDESGPEIFDPKVSGTPLPEPDRSQPAPAPEEPVRELSVEARLAGEAERARMTGDPVEALKEIQDRRVTETIVEAKGTPAGPDSVRLTPEQEAAISREAQVNRERASTLVNEVRLVDEAKANLALRERLLEQAIADVGAPVKPEPTLQELNRKAKIISRGEVAAKVQMKDALAKLGLGTLRDAKPGVIQPGANWQ